MIFSDLSWNDCIDIGRSTGGCIALNQGGTVDYGSHLSVPIAMSSCKAGYISAIVACILVSCLRMPICDLKFLGSRTNDTDNLTYESARIIN